MLELGPTGNAEVCEEWTRIEIYRFVVVTFCCSGEEFIAIEVEREIEAKITTAGGD